MPAKDGMIMVAFISGISASTLIYLYSVSYLINTPNKFGHVNISDIAFFIVLDAPSRQLCIYFHNIQHTSEVD